MDDSDAEVDLNDGSENDEMHLPTKPQILPQSRASPTPQVVSFAQEGVADEGSKHKGIQSV